MKVKVSFTEEQLIELIETSIKNKFPHENIEFGQTNINIVPADRDGPTYFRNVEVEVDFK